MAKKKNFNQIGLGIEESNKKAESLYRRFNFIETNINPYQDIWSGEDREGNKTGPFSSLVKYFVCKINWIFSPKYLTSSDIKLDSNHFHQKSTDIFG